LGKQKEKLTMSETVRQAILESGQTLYRVAKDSGVPYATLHRFVTGERSVSAETLDKLCAYLGLRLVR
jgi:plasmid maintenance system antidote protein VapI